MATVIIILLSLFACFFFCVALFWLIIARAVLKSIPAIREQIEKSAAETPSERLSRSVNR